jgi:hypothetical protein
VSEFDQFIRHAGHRGDHGHNLATLLLRLEQTARDIADALGRSDGGPAIFLHDQAHGEAGPG